MRGTLGLLFTTTFNSEFSFVCARWQYLGRYRPGFSGVDIDRPKKHHNVKPRVQRKVASEALPGVRANAKPVRRRDGVMTENRYQHGKMPGAWVY
jgi:hypothetical protein